MNLYLPKSKKMGIALMQMAIMATSFSASAARASYFHTGVTRSVDHMINGNNAYTTLLASVTGTLDFNGPDNSDLGTIVTDGEAGSIDIAGIDYQIFSTHADGSTKGTIWAYYNDVGIGKDGIVGDMLEGDPVVVIKSVGNVPFSFEGITTANVGVIHTRVTFEGFRNGVSTGSVTLNVDNAVTGINMYTTADLLPTVFQNVDEVRITNPDLPDGVSERTVFLAFDGIVFGDPVIPNQAPIIDANGSAGGTSNTITFTEGGGAVRIATSDASLTDDDNITGMTLVLGATPNGTDESIAYSSALNGGASLASVGLTGSYNSGTRTYTVSGTATAAMYQGVLRAMVYNNASDNPNTTARTVTISATDAEGATGQATATVNITAVIDAPSAPDLTASSDRGSSNTDNLTNDTTPTFTGTATAGTIVRLYADDVEVGSVTADGSGNWTITSTPLDEGTYDITARTDDGAGNLSAPSSSLAVTIDVTGPAVSTPDLTDASDSGSSNTDNITNVRRPEFTGTAPAGTLVQLFIDYAGNGDATDPLNEIIGTGTAGAGGTWSITPTVDLSPGTLSIKARGRDDAGNFGAASSSVNVTIDITPPAAVPAVPDLVPGSDTGSSSTDNLTNDTTPTFSGTYTANNVVRLYANGELVGSATANGSGNWTITSDALGAGTYSFTARGVDLAGNEGTASSSLSVTIDVTGPVVSTPDLADASDSGSSNTDNITNVRRPEFTGTAPAGTFIQLFIDNAGNGDATDPLNEIIGTGTAGAGGTWSITSTVDLSPGTWSIKARGQDDAGNFGAASSSVNVTIDITPPAAVPAVPDLATGSDTGSSDSDNLTNDTTPTFSGTYTANNVVRLYANGELVGSATANGSGNWTITSDALDAGTYSFTARGVDLAGNEGTASNGLSVTIDNAAPAAPSTPDMDADSDTGSSDSDNNTDDTTPTFSGTGAEANATVYLYVNGVEVGESTADGSGNWSVTVSAGMALDAGDYFVVVRTIDAAGNLSDASGALPIHINTAPTANGNLSQTVSYTEDPGGSVALGDIVVTEIDPGDAITATLTLSDPSAGTLSTGTYGSATSTYNAGTGVWTVSGSVADVNAALAAVAFTPSADHDQNFTITTRIRDAAGTGPADGTISVTVTAVNDAPTATNLTQTKTATEGGSAVALDDIVVTDVDAGETITATFTLSDPAAGTLSTGTFGSATSTYNAGTGVWTVTGPVADVNAALAAVAFTPSADNDQNFTITTRIRDAANTGPADGTISVTVTAVNDAPTATNLTQSKTATEGGSAVALDDIVVTDVDAGETVTATLTMSDPAAGSLSTGTFGSATSTYNAGTGVWTVTGPVADVNAALAAVAFTPSADNDQNFTITTRIRDAANTGPADGTISVTVTPVNDAPVVTAPATIAVTEDVPAALTGISFADVDAGSGNATATLSVPSGSLSATTGVGVTVGGTASALTLTGTMANINAFIAASNVTYTPAANATGNVVLTASINDNGNTGTGGSQQDSGTVTLQVTAVNDAPVMTAPATIAVTEDVEAALTGISFADVDAGSGNVTATLSVPSGSLSATGGAGVTVGGTASALTLTGTIADINAYIAAGNVTFTTAPNATGNVTLTVEIDDNGNAGTGGSQQDSGTVTLQVTAVNDAPTATNLTQAKIAAEGGSAIALDDIVVTDPDGGETITATLTMSDPAAGSLSTGTFGSATSTFNAGTGVWTVTGSVADVNAALAAVAFTPSADNDQNFTITTRIRDAAGTGPADGTVSVTVVDMTPPVVTAIEVSGTPAANAAAIQFTVYFDEVPANISTGDFILTSTGTASADLASHSPVNANTVTVTIDQISGTGTLRLDVVANPGITDTEGNGNGTNGYVPAFTGGELHTVDRDAPGIPAGLALDAGSDSGTAGDGITNDNTPTLNGTADANVTITVSSDVDGVLGTTTSNGSGEWSYTPTAPLTDGTHNLTATATDGAGNTSVASAALEITIDTTPHPKPSSPALATASDTGESNSDGITNLANLTLQGPAGSVEADARVHARSDLEGGLTNATANADGSWSLDVSGLVEGTHQLQITATDVAGNTSVYSDALTVAIDITEPTLTGVAVDQASVTAANQTAISISLDGAETGTKVAYTITGNNGGTPVTGSGLAVGSATQQFTGIDVSGLNDGTLTVSLTLVDLAGNVSASVINTVGKDAAVPSVSSVSIADGNYTAGDLIDISVTFDDDVTVSGTNSTLAIAIGGVTGQAVFVSENAGVLLYQYTVQAGDNTDGSGVVALANGISLNGDVIRDAGDNIANLFYAQSGTANAQVDTEAPVPPMVGLPDAATVVNAADYVISGTHPESGVTLRLYLDADDDGVPDNAVALDSDVVTDGSWSLSAPLVADSDNNFVVVAEDAVGNRSAAVDVPTITEDSVAPAAPSMPALSAASDSGVSDSDGITNITAVTLTGTAEPQSTVTLTSNLDGIVGTAVANGDGNWSLVTGALVDGVHSLTATATDAAGNESVPSMALELTIDTGEPTLSAIADQFLDPGVSSDALDVTLADGGSTPENLLFTAASSNLAVVPSANLVLGGSGASRTVTVKALGSGMATITLRAEDEAGNMGTVSFAVQVNSTPTISGTPETSVYQDVAYSFIPVADDIDGDELTYSITNKPDWADFDAATGELSGTPGNGDVGITTGIVIAVSDGTLSADLAAFDLEVLNVNDAPTINGTPATSVDQGMAYSFIPAAEDIDGDELTFNITNKPDWADFDPTTGELSGTPGNGDVGVTTGIVIAVGDGTESASLAAFDLEVNSVIISGITLPDGSFVYDGTAKSLKIVGDLPEGTSVRYAGNSRTDAGTQEVTATVSGGNYEDLVLTATLRITPGMRTLAFPVLAERTYGDDGFSGGASTSSGEEITYTSGNTAVAEITADGMIRITGAGEATITATVPVNGNYANRPEITQALVVRKASQTIVFNAPAEVNRDAGTVQLDVTASSGLPVTLSIDDEQVATPSGTALNVLRLGTVTITATQAGDGNHEAADPVTVTLRVVDPSSDFPVRVHQAVSPNGDGINEFLIIEGIRDYRSNRVSVINRNGTVVWEASGYDNDRVAFRGVGTGQQQLPAGTYFYLVELGTGSGTEYRKGYFVLRY